MPSCTPQAGWGVASASAKMLPLISRASSRTARTRRCAQRLIGCVRSIRSRVAFLRHGVTILITGPSLDQTATTPTKRASSKTFTSRGSITSGTSEPFPSPQSSTTASFRQIAGQLRPHSSTSCTTNISSPLTRYRTGFSSRFASLPRTMVRAGMRRRFVSWSESPSIISLRYRSTSS